MKFPCGMEDLDLKPCLGHEHKTQSGIKGVLHSLRYHFSEEILNRQAVSEVLQMPWHYSVKSW